MTKACFKCEVLSDTPNLRLKRAGIIGYSLTCVYSASRMNPPVPSRPAVGHALTDADYKGMNPPVPSRPAVEHALTDADYKGINPPVPPCPAVL